MLKKFYSNPTAIFLIIITLTIMGISRFLEMPIALYPPASKPQLKIYINTEGTSANDFRKRYSKDLESLVSGVDGVSSVFGRYTNGNAELKATFEWGISADEAKASVKAAVDSYASIFPEEWRKPRYRYDGGSDGRTMVTVRSKKLSIEELEIRLSETVLPSLRAIKGMERAFLWRTAEKHVEITVNPVKLLQFNLSYAQIKKALKDRKFDSSLGTLNLDQAGVYQVRAINKVGDLEDLKNIVVGYSGSQPIQLRHVAEIEHKPIELEEISKGNGERKVLVGGMPKPNANLRNFADDVLSLVKKRCFEIDPDMEIDILLEPSSFINEAVNNVLVAVLIGMFVATIIVFIFLRSIRNTLIIGLSIPLSLISGFIIMAVIGIGINLISLGAMALAVGMVVDGAIVVLENIARHFEIEEPQNKNQRLEVILNAVKEVNLPIIASLLTTIIVFAPLPFTSPLANAILGDLAIVMVCVLSVSLIVTIFVIPGLILFFGMGNGQKDFVAYKLPQLFNVGFAKLTNLYLKAVRQILTNFKIRNLSIAILSILFVVGAYLLFDKVPREIMGKPDTDKLWIWLDFKENFEINIADKIATEVERDMLKKFNADIKHTFSEVSQNGSWILATLKDKRQVNRLKKEFEEYFKNTPELQFYVGTWTPTSLEIPNPPLVEVNVAGSDDAMRRENMELIVGSLNSLDKDVGRINQEPSPSKSDYLDIKFNQHSIDNIVKFGKQHQIDSQKILSEVSGYLNSSNIFEMKLNQEDVNVDIRLPKKTMTSPSELGNLLMRINEKIVPIKAFADIEHKRDFREYQTENGRSIARVSIWPKESFVGNRDKLREQIVAAIKASEVDQSLLSFNDTDVEINENIRSLTGALTMALGLICILITLQFGSLLRTGIIMVAIPFGFLGVSYSLWLFGSALNVNSMLGLILLCGTAVNNSIIFLDFYQRVRNQFGTSEEALMETAKIRFRPIMVTTMTTILGMLPIAFGFGSGGEILQPLGIAVCGGLGISTAMTLLFLPLTIQKAEDLSLVFKKSFTQRGSRAGAITTSTILIVVAASLTFTSEKLVASDTEKAISLKQCELLAVDSDPELKQMSLNLESTQINQRAQYADLLPAVSIERMYIEQEYFYAKELGTIKSGINTLKVEESLSTPMRWWKERAVRNAAYSAAEQNLENYRLKILKAVRQQYFSTLINKIMLQNAKKNLQLAMRNQEISDKRYNGGFIHIIDKKRTDVKVRQAESHVTELEESVKIETEKLNALIGRKQSPLILNASLPTTYAYFDWDEGRLESLIHSNRPRDELAKRELTQAEASLQLSKTEIWPDLSLSMSYAKADPNLETTNNGVTYLASIKWRIFSGGEDYYNYRAALINKSIYEEKQAQVNRSSHIMFTTQMRELIKLKKIYAAETFSLDTLEEIHLSTQKRFQKGLTSSDQVNEDFQSYLDQQDRLLRTALKIIEAAAEISEIIGRPELFYDLMGNNFG